MSSKKNKIKIILFANGDLGLLITRFLVKQKENIVGLVTNPIDKSEKRDRIIKASCLDKKNILTPKSFEIREVSPFINERNPDLICSIWSRYIFSSEIINSTPKGIVNLHNSLLPLCRGAGGNIWPIIDNFPSGVTLHYIEEEIDEGGIIDQKKVPVYLTDTGKDLFERQIKEMVSIFSKNWDRIKKGNIKTKKQDTKSSFYLHNDFYKIMHIKKEKKYKAIDLVNILRALTFPPYTGAYIIDPLDKKKVYLELKLKKEK